MPSGELPRSCVVGAGRIEVSSVCRKRAENFSGSLGRADEWAETAMDIIGQRFRAVETSVLEEGGWGVARHLEVVPETRVSSVTPGLRATVAAAERQSRWRGSSMRTQEGVSARSIINQTSPTISPVQWTQPRRRKRKRSKAKEKAKAVTERRQGTQGEQRQGSQAWLAGGI